MIYVMSDLHGDSKRFYQMLDKINFSKEDELYVLGDVIDRGKDGIPLIQYIMKQPNIHMLLGNHEQLCLDTFDGTMKSCWMANGGKPTYDYLKYKLDEKEREEVLQFMRELPWTKELEVEGKKYFFVHGWVSPSNTDLNKEKCLWDKPYPDSPAPFKDKTVICGHTVTYFLDSQRTWFDKRHFNIYHGDNWMDIDCGCGNDDTVLGSYIALACYCLNTGEEFYI